MSQEVLGRHGHDQLHVSVYHALAGQAGVDAWVLGAVDEVLFFVADFGQLIAARVDVNMASTAPAHATAIVLELNAVIERHVEHRLAGGRHVGLGRLAVAELEGDGGGENRQSEKRKRRENTAFAAAKVLGAAPASKLSLDAGRELAVEGQPGRVRRQRRLVGGQGGRIGAHGRASLHREGRIGQGFIHRFVHQRGQQFRRQRGFGQ